MKFVTYIHDGKEQVGVVTADGGRVIPTGQACMAQMIAQDSPAFRQEMEKLLAAGGGLAMEDVQLQAPIPHPAHDIFCLGMNYLEHALESCRWKGVEYVPAKKPVYFTKRVNRSVAPGGAIAAHTDITSQLDYEVELAVVIGKRCDHVKPEAAFDHIFGYTIVNDVSARDIQIAHGGQFCFGKSLDDFTPMGPCIVTRDEFDTPPNLQVITRVNGDVRQDGNTGDFIFDIPYIIAELSAGFALEPGDIIITGTPSGVAMGMQEPKFLKPGDVVECEIEGIGVLRNTVK